MKNSTENYYNKNSENYFQKTVNIQPLNAWREFLDVIPENAHILDAGCGSGRDTKYFLKNGYKVTSMDVSENMAKRARVHTGNDVLVRSFCDIAELEAYDAVWCYASLLHLEEKELLKALDKIKKSLKKDGVLFMCFKHGETQGVTECGRYYLDMNDERYAEFDFISKGWIQEKVWIEPCPMITDETRPDWYSILLRKE